MSVHFLKPIQMCSSISYVAHPKFHKQLKDSAENLKLCSTINRNGMNYGQNRMKISDRLDALQQDQRTPTQQAMESSIPGLENYGLPSSSRSPAAALQFVFGSQNVLC